MCVLYVGGEHTVCVFCMSVVSTQYVCVLYVGGEHTVCVFCMSVVSTQYVCSVRRW